MAYTKVIKQYCIKEFSLLLVFALLLISELTYSQTAASNRFKRIDYEYDLISGKVNTVSYQKDSADQFIHQYTYDADNRITKVETSSDNVIWDIDAKYYYYAHGPLSRTELGNNKVQGLDYAYTLQGWIKGVNSNSLDKTRDIGQDALANEIYDPANPQLHSNVASDAFGYTLNYFQKDYRAINVLRWSDVTNRFEAEASATSTLKTNRFDLFNGNISSMVTTITQLDSTAAGLVKAQIPKPLGNAYKYDQLNRLKKSVSFNNTDLPNNLWLSSGQAVANMYSNTFTYDANGNILSQNRNNELGTEFDAMSYNYKRDANNKFLQNRLYHVNDNTTYTALKTDDIDDEGTFTSDNLLINTNNNYGYDAIGNLTKDKAEQIDKIEWTVYGKIKSITRTGGSTKDNLVFNYDAAGNRISKKVLDNGNNVKYTIYYVRDAQGNVMSTYEHKYIAAGGGGTPVASFVLQEQHLYGSSRIGMNTPNAQLIYPTVLSNGTAYNHLQGLKQFELSNHLGNVLAVITDRKLPVDVDGDNTIDYYQSDITSTSDYSAFGVKLYNRGFSFDKYRYGFNGKENDREAVGTGSGTQDYGMRIYNPALGKFLSVDPLAVNYPMLTPYQFAGNKPIWAIDLDGLEETGYTRLLDKQMSTVAGAQQAITNNKEIAKAVYKPVAAALFKSAFSENLPKTFIDHYVKGDGKTMTLNPVEMAQVNTQPIGLASGLVGQQVNAQISGMLPGESRKIAFSASDAQAGSSGTLGQFTISGEGTFTMGESGDWSFSGTMQFSDTWDFNVETPEQEVARAKETGVTRSANGKQQTEFAAKYLPGKGFDIKSEKVSITQTSKDKHFSWFKGKSSESIPNRDTKVKSEVK